MSAPLQSWIIETLIATTGLMLIILMIRGFVAARFGTRAAYLLWLAPALRMIMPPLPQHWFYIPSFAAQGQVLKDAAVVITDVSSVPVMAAVTSDGRTDWAMLLGIVWLGGAAIFFMRHLIAYHRFSERVLTGARRVDCPNHIGIAASAVIASPIALGIFERRIIVPEDFETRFDITEQRLALAHETTHHQRGDLPVNLVALVMLALHWFNPVAHIAHRAFRLDQESACDAIVLHGATMLERHAYGRALFKAATGPVPITVCAMGATTTLKARLQHIIARSEQPERLLAGATLAIALIGGGLALTASTSFASDVDPLPTRKTTDRAVQRDIDEAQRDAEEALLIAQEARRDAEEAMRDAEENLTEAERDASSAISEAEREARAEAGNSKEAAAEAQRSIRAAQAEARRAIAEARRSLAEARQNMIEPPVPPASPRELPEAEESPEPPEAPEAPEPSALSSNEGDCPEGTNRQVVRNTWRDNSEKLQSFNMILCNPSEKAIRKTVATALRSAPKTIDTEIDFGEEQRAWGAEQRKWAAEQRRRAAEQRKWAGEQRKRAADQRKQALSQLDR
jgi:bla regulator protein blaR1